MASVGTGAVSAPILDSRSYGSDVITGGRSEHRFNNLSRTFFVTPVGLSIYKENADPPKLTLPIIPPILKFIPSKHKPITSDKELLAPSNQKEKSTYQVSTANHALKMHVTDRPVVVVDSNQQTHLSFEIVVSHYNEDLTWLKQHRAECTIYSKGGEKNAPELPFTYTPLPNIGREGHTFLYHIANQYEKLADVTLFVQGRIDDHVDMTLTEMKAKAMTTVPGQVTTYPFRELELFEHWEGIPWEKYPCWKRWSAMATQRMSETPLEIFQKYISESDRMPVAVGFAPGAIFAVRKETIMTHSKAFYERLLQKMFLGVMAHVNPDSGHYMERFWLAMFNPSEYVQWDDSELSTVERNEDGQLAKGRWYRTPLGSAVDPGAIRRGEEVESPTSSVSPVTASSNTPESSETELSTSTDEETLDTK
ncbi:MAG: hypothetical protein Q9168_008111 [Polycauliona sp. 1 TL-2023]